ncbi:mannose-6-phosphate receptor binding domain-containing protein [Peziza echinospora]|nr:mannose-6-phosphate receptor binding domain-containing protein [Peziza echinospora]
MRRPRPLHRLLTLLPLLLLLLHPTPITASDSDPACTITSPVTHNFFDLRPLALSNLTGSSAQTDYISLGHDYPANFTLNICAPVLSPLAAHAVDLPPGVANVSAFYTLPKKPSRRRGPASPSPSDENDNEEEEVTVYSLGTPSTHLLLRGRKLILELTNGSRCPTPSTSTSSSSSSTPPTPLYKSTLLTFLCDPGPLDPSLPPTISFIGSLADCLYVFEVRTPHACPTYHDDSAAVLGPFAIFVVVLAVFAVVYCVGGCVYQRTVLNARGWRQVPHGNVWRGWGRRVAGVVGWVVRRRRGGGGGGGRYSGLNSGGGGGYGQVGGGGRRRGPGGVGVGGVAPQVVISDHDEDDDDDENRLLDQLDEEWDE